MRGSWHVKLALSKNSINAWMTANVGKDFVPNYPDEFTGIWMALTNSAFEEQSLVPHNYLNY